jgi:hypothetical protein
MPMSERPPLQPISLADRELSQLYRKLALECFLKAVTADQPDGAETLRQMGRRYVAHAGALDRSLV